MSSARSRLAYNRPLARAFQFLIQLFVLAFSVDAAISVADEGLRALAEIAALDRIRGAAAATAVLLALPCAAVLVLTPRAPWKLLVLLLVFLAWATLGAMPLPLVLAPSELTPLLAGVQALLAVGAFCGGSSWRAGVEPAELPLFSLRLALRRGLASAVIGPLGLLAYGAFSLGAVVEHSTGGFVRFGWNGLEAHERTYSDGERFVHLVGMIHVGERDAYRDLFASFSGESTIVLAEGVSDGDRRLTFDLPYAKLASSLGLVEQPRLEEALADLAGKNGRAGPVVRNADVDVRAFSPETLALLEEIAAIYSSENLGTALLRAQPLFTARDTPARLATLERDLIELRNAHLAEEIGEALRTHRRVVVPWGALHLPGIEQVLERRGFVLVEGGARTRTLVRYATIGEALLSF